MSASATFDGDHPPSSALIAACVHCGFCLPTCPTYALWGEEMDSPRGRLYLMKAGLEGRTAMAPSFVQHFDACLGCMACVTACPSGVQYAPLIEATRGQIERRFERSRSDRLFRSLIFALFPYPGRLRLALLPLALWQAVVRGSTFGVGRARRANDEPRTAHDEPGTAHAERRTANDEPSTTHVERRTTNDVRLWTRFRAMLALAPKVTWRSLFTSLPERTPASGSRRTTVALLTGCVQRVIFPQVNRATVNVLAAEGCDVVAPADQGCCGALALHAGRLDDARAWARKTIESLDRAGIDQIVVNAAGCGSSMKEYAQLLADDPQWAARARAFSARVRDVTELLASLGPPRAPRHPLALRVAYHDACHLAHAQRITKPPRELVKAVAGKNFVELPESDVCCGSAGTYNLTEPEMAEQLQRRKTENILRTKADLVVTSNPGCLLQMQAGLRKAGSEVEVLHIADFLDRATG